MQVLGGEHGQVRALSLRELHVIHVPTAELCTQTASGHTLLRLWHSPYLVLMFALLAFGSEAVHHRLSAGRGLQGFSLYSSSKKEAEHPRTAFFLFSKEKVQHYPSATFSCSSRGPATTPLTLLLAQTPHALPHHCSLV